MAFGIYKADGGNITGFSAPVQPDKGMARATTSRTLTAQFGDGYEQRTPQGINNINQSIEVGFNSRPKDEIDDIVAFYESKKGATSFSFVMSDSNGGSNEETMKVVCENWSQTWKYDDYYDLKATFRRLYEA